MGWEILGKPDEAELDHLLDASGANHGITAHGRSQRAQVFGNE